ncbi:hypothetical protein MSPP1_003836 [Malassezia sp. CBS 17886]|nr:hypothetical protein MSPP1_003836 [Malassezia sp. CBS 17886]
MVRNTGRTADGAHRQAKVGKREKRSRAGLAEHLRAARDDAVRRAARSDGVAARQLGKEEARRQPAPSTSSAPHQPALSKSSARREKHRQREQLAGNRDGMQDLTDVVASMEAAVPKEDTAPRAHPAATARTKRAVLLQERERQGHILSDLAQTANPFAALRTHARNALSLRPARPTGAADEPMRPD